MRERIRVWRQDARFRRSTSTLIWRGSEQLVRLLTSLVVGLWVARHLQPESYGLLQFAMSWVSIFTALAWLGVGDTLVRDFVRLPEQHGRLLGTAALIRLSGSCVAGALAIGITAAFYGDHPHSETLLLLVAILSLAIPFAEGPAGISAWFQARGDVKRISVAANAIRITASLAKVALIVAGMGVVGFALVSLAEWMLLCAALLAIYWRVPSRPKWRTSMASARSMLRECLPLALAAVVTTLNARADQVMLGWLSDFQQVGIYAAATRFSELWWIVPVIVVNALSPSYIYVDQPRERVRKNVAWIGALLLIGALAAGLATSLLAPPVITWLLGPAYASAGAIVVIHVWLAVFVFIDAPVTHYLLATQRQHWCTVKVMVTLVLNIALNALMIPPWGAQGAAVATLTATLLSNLLVYRLLPATRDVPGLYVDMLRVIASGLRPGTRAAATSTQSAPD